MSEPLEPARYWQADGKGNWSEVSGDDFRARILSQLRGEDDE